MEKADKPSSDRFKTYEEFWPYYLKEHNHKNTRYLHYLGSSAALLALGGAVAMKKPQLLLAVPLAGAGTAGPPCTAGVSWRQLLPCLMRMPSDCLDGWYSPAVLQAMGLPGLGTSQLRRISQQHSNTPCGASTATSACTSSGLLASWSCETPAALSRCNILRSRTGFVHMM